MQCAERPIGSAFSGGAICKNFMFFLQGAKGFYDLLLISALFFCFFIRRSKTADLVQNLVYIILGLQRQQIKKIRRRILMCHFWICDCFFGRMDRFPPGVEAAIAEVFPSDDPLDDPDFNATDYINQVKEGSLSDIEAKFFVRKMKGVILYL